MGRAIVWALPGLQARSNPSFRSPLGLERNRKPCERGAFGLERWVNSSRFCHQTRPGMGPRWSAAPERPKPMGSILRFDRQQPWAMGQSMGLGPPRTPTMGQSFVWSVEPSAKVGRTKKTASGRSG